jgi:hypothetical protein
MRLPWGEGSEGLRISSTLASTPRITNLVTVKLAVLALTLWHGNMVNRAEMFLMSDTRSIHLELSQYTS